MLNKGTSTKALLEYLRFLVMQLVAVWMMKLKNIASCVLT